MRDTTVAVLRGGPSSEYDISMKTGAGVLAVLKDEPLTLRDIIVTRGGEWLVNGYVKTPEQALIGVDIAFIAMHGEYGEDGQVQRVLERYGVPYTGSTPFSSSRAMNKEMTKQHLKAFGVKMPKHMRVGKESNAHQVASTITDMFGKEYVVKPVCGGSSLSTFMATRETLAKTLQQAFEKCDTVMVEERIRGREATVGILEGYRDTLHYIMPVIEIVPPAGKDFFSEEIKYTGETDEIVPGRFTKGEREELQSLAHDIHNHLELRHYSRSDFMVSPDGIYFLETNTLPGLTDQSLFPKSMEAVGGSYKELILHLLQLARRTQVGRR